MGRTAVPNAVTGFVSPRVLTPRATREQRWIEFAIVSPDASGIARAPAALQYPPSANLARSACRFIHVSKQLPVLRTGQSGGREVLQRLRRRFAPGTVPALRGGERCNGDRVLPVPRPASRARDGRARPSAAHCRSFQAIAWCALSSHRRRRSSRGDRIAGLLRLPPNVAR